MNLQFWVIVALSVIFLLIVFNYSNIIALLNSHLGTNLSTQESDNQNKQIKNFISHLYDNQIESDYQNCPFKHYRKPDRLPEIDISQLTKEKFLRLSNNLTRPIVVRRFLKDAPAVKKWNLDFFAHQYGQTQLPVILNADIKTHRSYMSNKGSEKYEYVKMKDFVDGIRKGKKMYINNISRIFGYHPELLNDLNLEKIEKYTGEDIKNEVHITNLFFGGKETGTSLHCAMTGNFFYNIKGRKLWYLIDPKYTRYLRPLLSRTGLFAVSRLDICNAKPGDYVLNIPRYEVELEEGDLLLNCQWWWHAITNKTDYTIACANKFTNFWSGFKNNPLYTVIFFSHPIANYNDFGKFKTREEANIGFDKALLSDILKQKKKIN